MEFQTLIQQPESRRDDKWEHLFLTQFPQLKVQLDGDSARQGPDGFPYLFVRTEADEANESSMESVPEVIQWLGDKGIGLVVNAHKMLPDYVFPFGMIWNFIETGRFLGPELSQSTSDAVYSSDQKVLTGPPSEKYLPPYIRTVLTEFLRAQGVKQPRILVVTTADFKNIDLVLSVESLGAMPKSDHKKFAEMMAWFLPLHYTLVLAEENGLPSFHPL